MTGSGHPSALVLDALALDALDGDTAGRVRAHLAGCAVCRADQRAAAELRERFAVSVLPRKLPARRARRWPKLVIPALAAALLAVLLHRPAPVPEVVPEFAIKGDASWQVFAHRDGQTFTVRDGTGLAPGDRIRFVVRPAGARYVLVASVDGGGAVTMYHPYQGAQSAPIQGDRIELPGSITLDAAPGPERIYAILSDAPLAAESVRARLAAVAAGGADAIRGARALQVPARAQLSLVFEKIRR